jgi:4-amino-4-deoxy-L-arabinose transferase-like glycosyltransferase
MIKTRQFESTQIETIVKLVGFICVLSAPLWVYGLFFPFPSYFGIENHLPTVLLVLVLVLAVQLVLIQKVSSGNRFTAEVMGVGFLLKLAAVSAYMYMTFHVYEGTADALLYFGMGSRIADGFSLTGDWNFPRPFWSTNIFIIINGVLIYIIGPAFQAIMIIFATLSFWGQYLLFRAFCIAFPGGRHKVAALFMFCFPSIVFWTSTIGKDAVILFFIGACCYGFAKMKERTDPIALVTVLVSLGGVMLVRPHVAAMLATAFAYAYLLSRNRTGLLGMAAKIVGIALLLLVSVYLVAQARTFLDLGDIGQTVSVLTRVGDLNQFGGSAFGSSTFLYRLVAAPFLLFRPFPWEVRSPQAAIAGIEALGLVIFVWRRREFVRSFLRTWRENAFVLFSWVYILEFSLVFAGAITNFGTLARQRVMLLPMALMVILSQRVPTVGSLRITAIRKPELTRQRRRTIHSLRKS